MTLEPVDSLVERLRPSFEHGPVCPFCGRDPYHYVDIGVGMDRAAVNCCDLGVGLFQDDDEQLVEIVQRMSDAADRIAALTAEVARKDEALRKVMPIRVEDGPDYASVYFGDGSTHSTQAMTMNPQDWLDISAALEARPESHQGEERCRLNRARFVDRQTLGL